MDDDVEEEQRDRRESHGDECEDILRPRTFVQPHSSELSVRDEREDQALHGRGPCTREGLLARRGACGESICIRGMSSSKIIRRGQDGRG